MENYQRVIYKKCPLVEVVFQLRFPTILSINSQLPTEFQDKIRQEYPYFTEATEQQNNIVIDGSGNASINFEGVKNYSFVTADSNCKINLTSSFISISTLNYSRWEDFFERIKTIIPVFDEIYKPAFYTRIGLRYVDVFTRSAFGLDGEKWNSLFNPHILGIMNEQLEDGFNSYSVTAEYNYPTSNYLIRNHFDLVHVNNSPELSFLIDSDYYSNTNISLDKVEETATQLHDNSKDFISKAITEKLHYAMEPEVI